MSNKERVYKGRVFAHSFVRRTIGLNELCYNELGSSINIYVSYNIIYNENTMFERIKSLKEEHYAFRIDINNIYIITSIISHSEPTTQTS